MRPAPRGQLALAAELPRHRLSMCGLRRPQVTTQSQELPCTSGVFAQRLRYRSASSRPQPTRTATISTIIRGGLTMAMVKQGGRGASASPTSTAPTVRKLRSRIAAAWRANTADVTVTTAPVPAPHAAASRPRPGPCSNALKPSSARCKSSPPAAPAR